MRISISLDEAEEELAISNKFSDEELYYHAQKSKLGAIQYLTVLWHRINTDIFHGELKLPKLYIMKDVGTKFRTLGIWYGGTRKLGISDRLFHGKEIPVLTTLVHEICHQAVHEIDHVYSREEQGHGIEWQRWMVHAGLTPSRYSKYDMAGFMTPEELQAYMKRKQDNESSKVGMFSNLVLDPAPGVMCKVMQRGEWMYGILVGPESKARKNRWIFLDDPRAEDFKFVPTSLLKPLTAEEWEVYKHQQKEFNKACDDMIEHYRSKTNDYGLYRSRVHWP